MNIPGKGRVPIDIYQAVYLLARKLHWSEEEILSLNSYDRRMYLELLFAELAEQERAVEEAERESRRGIHPADLALRDKA